MNHPGRRMRFRVLTILFSIAFCGFVIVFEIHSRNAALNRATSHARVIADALWNYNARGIEEYLHLVVVSEDNARLSIYDNRGVLFADVESAPPTFPENLLLRMGLILREPLAVPVFYRGARIGRIHALWRSHAIYADLLVFLGLVLILAVIHLYARTIQDKRTLEDRVRQRTLDLEATNASLVQEVRERKEAESALRDSEEQYRLLAENISDVIWTMDLEMRFTYFSPAITRLLGWSEEEMMGMSLDDVLTPEGVIRAMAVFEEKWQESERSDNFKNAAALELEMFTKAGGTVWTEVKASFLLNGEGRPTGILGVTRDITDRRRAEKEKEDLQEKLNRSKKMEALGLLAGGVAHDLNNVLSGIVSYPDLLLMDLSENSPLRKPILTIKESGQKAAAIVEDLLTLARRGMSATEVLNVNTIVGEYLASPEHQRIMSFHPKVTVEVRLMAEMPNIVGSAVHLKKTIMNLVTNAAEAQPGGGLIQVTSENRFLNRPVKGYDKVEPGEYVVIRVSDQGLGIPQGDLPRIFEPFFSRKTMGRSGTGLGMAVVWGTIQDHKGYVDVQSRLNHGTTFELYFPLTRKSIRAEDMVCAVDDIMGNGETVLVVDDSREQREISAGLLRRLNYVVDTAASGEVAVAMLDTRRVDLLLLDMIMDPGIDGLETYERILKRHPDQRAVIASGYAETTRVRRAMTLGAVTYLKKPFSLPQLGKAVRAALCK